MLLARGSYMKSKMLFAISLFGLLFSGCGETKEHVHEWNNPTYSFSSDYSSCTARRICKLDESHVEEETTTTTVTVVSESCYSGKNTRYTAVFENKAFKTVSKDVTTSLGHDWDTPTYTWSDDRSECTAQRICKRDNTHIETETVQSTSTVLTNPTYYVDGEMQYTATFTKPDFEPQTLTEPILKLNKLVFTLNEGSYSVKATATDIDGDIVIPATYNGLPVTSIEDHGFMNCTQITSVQLPDSLTRINQYAFGGCSSLVSVNIPGTVNYLCGFAFYNCTSLRNLSIGNGVAFIGNTSSDYFVFRNCTSLVDLYLPDSVQVVGIYSFQGCTSLKNVRYPDNDTVYSTGCFMECVSLRNAPTRVYRIDGIAFGNCYSLTEVNIGYAAGFGAHIFANCKSIKKANFTEGCVMIPDNVLNDCASLTQVIIGSTVVNMGQLPFCDCPQLLEVINKSSIVLTKEDECFALSNNIEYIISSESSSKMTTLDNVTFYIKTSGDILFVDYANKDCTSLTIPSYCTEIGNTALYNFNNLETLNYEGTIENWNNMTKGTEWNYGVPATVVHCSNGNVTL